MAKKTNSGSAMAFVATLEVGETRYIETTVDTYSKDMRAYNPGFTRRPEFMKDRVFETRLYTAIPAGGVSTVVKHLIAVTRVS